MRAVRVDRTEAQRHIAHGAVETGRASWSTRRVLFERDLVEKIEEDPPATIASLHDSMLREGASPDLLLALAELSYLHAEQEHRPEYHLAAVIYAYAFLFPDDPEAERVDPLDPRLRDAADLYNWSLTAAFSTPDGKEFEPRSGSRWLPFGYVGVEFDASDLRVHDRELHGFVPIAEFDVEGLAVRYRQGGIGAPLAAQTRTLEDSEDNRDMIAGRLRIPVTALLRIPQPRRALLRNEPFRAKLEIHSAWQNETTQIGGNTVPLELEPTTALAMSFNEIAVLRMELLAFMGRESGFGKGAPNLASTTPYQPGLLPIVFIHGTASSPVRWAEMYNRLEADPEIRSRYQFWFFRYDSDAPVALSALRLREALDSAVERLDPEGKDPALREIILVGHSQGGLLAKMQSIDSGDRIWNAVSTKPLDELELSSEAHDLMQRVLFVEPNPNVARIVFVATPHRGSFLAASDIASNLARWFTRLPSQIVGVSGEVLRNLDPAGTPYVPTAVDNMAPGSPFIQGLQEIPVVPTVPAHSIIAVEGTGPAVDGDDGVVAYQSAHIEEAVSELVVRSPHSCQANPRVIEEVRRILREHAGLPPVETPPQLPAPS